MIVLFEWEGSPGLHRCEARWKDPSGKVVLVSPPIDHQATSRRFSIYWTLALPEALPGGLWAVETTVDGVAAGTHVFEIAGQPATAPTLSQAELFQRASAAVATVESYAAGGAPLGQGPAVALDDEHVVTRFSLIDGAELIRLRAATGATLESREVGGWNRRGGWAVLRFPNHGLTTLKRSAASLGVGERCFVLDSGEDGSRMITEAAVVGQEAPPSSLARLSLGLAPASPVLDGKAELLGIVAEPGLEDRVGAVWLTAGLRASTYNPRGSAVLPIGRLPETHGTRATLADLEARGEFMKPLSPDQKHVISGIFAANVTRGGAVPMPQDQRTTFSRREGQVSLFIQWNPQGKQDSVTRLEIFDSDYRPVVKGTPDKVKLRPGNLFFQTWTLGVGQLPAGVYRVDVLLGDGPVWRGYIKLTD